MQLLNIQEQPDLALTNPIQHAEMYEQGLARQNDGRIVSRNRIPNLDETGSAHTLSNLSLVEPLEKVHLKFK